MTFWNAARLADDLREGRVSEKQKLYYLLVSFTLHALGGNDSIVDALRSDRPGSAIWPVLGVAIIAATLIACYRVNSRGDGRHDLDRVYCLSVPVALPVYAAYLAAVFAFRRLAGPLTPADGSVPKLGPYLLWIALYFAPLIVIYARLRHYVARAAGATP